MLQLISILLVLVFAGMTIRHQRKNNQPNPLINWTTDQQKREGLTANTKARWRG